MEFLPDPPCETEPPEDWDGSLPPGMTDAETAAWIRTWCASPQSRWGWPTDACGYEQHIRFVHHRNAHFKQGEDFNAFALAYADSIDPAKLAEREK